MPAGFDWRTSGSTGVFIPAEVGYLTGFGDARLPSKYDVGFWYDTSQYTKGNQAGNPTVTGRKLWLHTAPADSMAARPENQPEPDTVRRRNMV